MEEVDPVGAARLRITSNNIQIVEEEATIATEVVEAIMAAEDGSPDGNVRSIMIPNSIRRFIWGWGSAATELSNVVHSSMVHLVYIL